MERKRYLDFLRIIAISAVIMIHVSADFVMSYNSFLEFTIGNIFDSCSRLGVPLFLMISGALMLDENKEFDCKKRILSLLIPLLAWSFLYAFAFSIVLPVLKSRSFSFLSFVSNFLRGHFHLWYMWAIIGLYLITPILRKFVKTKNKKTVFYFIILSLFFRFTEPIINLLFEEIDFFGKTASIASVYSYIFDKLNLDFLGGLTTYYLAGWLLVHTDFTKKNKIAFYIIGGISLISIIMLTQLFPNQYDLTYSNFNILVFLYSSAVFLLVKNLRLDCKKLDNSIIALSKLSFGAYLIHMFVITIISHILPQNPFFIPLIFLCTAIISFAATYIISKIPFIKKIVKA